MSTVLSTLAEGGQTWVHRVRMLRQVLRIGAAISLLVGICVFTYKNIQIDQNYHLSIWYYCKAFMASCFGDSVSIDQEYWSKVSHEYRSGQFVTVSTAKVMRIISPHVDRWMAFEYHLFRDSFSICIYTFLTSLGFFFVRGGISKKKQHVSGQNVISPWLLRSKLKISRNAGDISIGNIPMVKGSETQHLLISGGTGSGKSTCIHGILRQLRDQGSRAVVLDATGEYVSKYYREGKDIILNPFDDRGTPWHP